MTGVTPVAAPRILIGNVRTAQGEDGRERAGDPLQTFSPPGHPPGAQGRHDLSRGRDWPDDLQWVPEKQYVGKRHLYLTVKNILTTAINHS